MQIAVTVAPVDVEPCFNELVFVVLSMRGSLAFATAPQACTYVVAAYGLRCPPLYTLKASAEAKMVYDKEMVCASLARDRYK